MIAAILLNLARVHHKRYKFYKRFIKENYIIILESTSPVGTLNKIKKILDINKVDTQNLYMAYCPERVIPGNTIKN